MTVPVVVINDETVASVRGRPFWNYVFVAAAVLTSITFASSLQTATGDAARGFGGGIAIGVCFILARAVHIYLGRNQSGFLSTSLAAQFFLRGAIMSIFLAMVIEIVGLSELRPKPVRWRDAPVALIVGFAEEISKLLAVTAGLVVVASRLPQDLVLVRQELHSKCVRFWSVLVESPRALAAAGIAAGFGFMMSENIEYFFMVFILADAGSCAAMAAMRIFLNLHPMLTGLAAARLAKLIYTPQGVRTVSVGKVASALWPSVTLHALFDFGLMFATSNPEDQFDTFFIVTSILIIPTSFGMLVSTYRSLPVSSGTPLLVHPPQPTLDV